MRKGSMLRGVRLRKIGHVDEGVVEGGEDTGNAKDELAWDTLSVTESHARARLHGFSSLTLTGLRSQLDILLLRSRCLLGSHFLLLNERCVCCVANQTRPAKFEASKMWCRRKARRQARSELGPVRASKISTRTPTSSRLHPSARADFDASSQHSRFFGLLGTFVGADSYLAEMSSGQDAVVGIIGMGDMGKMYARRIAAAGWR